MKPLHLVPLYVIRNARFCYYFWRFFAYWRSSSPDVYNLPFGSVPFVQLVFGTKNSFKMERGLFIVFEGPDYSEKTSQGYGQAQRLINRLPPRSDGLPTAVWFHFPPYAGPNAFAPANGAAFAAWPFHLPNIREKAPLIIKALERGQHVIVDRYAYTELAFLLPREVSPLKWSLEALEGLPKPGIITLDGF